jgi:GrpB protein
VASFEPLAAFKQPLERLGYVYRAGNTERTKRYFREPPAAGARTYTFAGPAASPSSGLCCFATTCAPTRAAAEYEAVKHRLASEFRDDRHGYTDAKAPFM